MTVSGKSSAAMTSCSLSREHHDACCMLVTAVSQALIICNHNHNYNTTNRDEIDQWYVCTHTETLRGTDGVEDGAADAFK